MFSLSVIETNSLSSSSLEAAERVGTERVGRGVVLEVGGRVVVCVYAFLGTTRFFAGAAREA